jgi:hypothetical protein
MKEHAIDRAKGLFSHLQGSNVTVLEVGSDAVVMMGVSVL